MDNLCTLKDQQSPAPQSVPPWVEAYFGDAYGEVYRTLIDQKAELHDSVRWIHRQMGWGAEDRVLDLACGYGRHLLEMAAFPGRFFGLDLVSAQLKHAAATLPPNRVGLIQGDMSRLPLLDGSLDAVVLLFNSFGYRDSVHTSGDAPERTLLAEISRVLRPRARLLMEVPDRETVIQTVRDNPHTVIEQGSTRITENWHLEHGGAVLHGESTFEKDGNCQVVSFTVRMFSLTEITHMAKAAGLRLVNTWGDLAGTPYRSADSDQLVILMERLS